MNSPDPASLAHSILIAPGWARAGLIAQSERVREQAAAELARAVVLALELPAPADDARQMPLPF